MYSLFFNQSPPQTVHSVLSPNFKGCFRPSIYFNPFSPRRRRRRELRTLTVCRTRILPPFLEDVPRLLHPLHHYLLPRPTHTHVHMELLYSQFSKVYFKMSRYIYKIQLATSLRRHLQNTFKPGIPTVFRYHKYRISNALFLITRQATR